MSITLTPGRYVEAGVVYPESDGKRIAENTLQFRWIAKIHGNIDALFADDGNVFVAGDLLWYPVQGDNRTRMAPDVMVAFGRPRGDRGSYIQWLENGVAPQVVWEILSPGNRAGEMSRKLDFYDRYGVEEYYFYDPERLLTRAYIRGDDGHLHLLADVHNWVSPRLGIRFEVTPGEPLRLYHPNGEPFITFQEIIDERDAERWARARAESESRRADESRIRAETESRRADESRIRAETESRRADESRIRAETELGTERAARERLEARLRALGIDPDTITKD